jgi:hypothetical protein
MNPVSDAALLDYICGAGGPTYSTGELDAKIYRAVESGINNFPGICTRLGVDPKGDAPRGETPEWRVVDRRLQWMRKAGFIAHTRKTGWVALDPRKSRGAS